MAHCCAVARGGVPRTSSGVDQARRLRALLRVCPARHASPAQVLPGSPREHHEVGLRAGDVRRQVVRRLGRRARGRGAKWKRAKRRSARGYNPVHIQLVTSNGIRESRKLFICGPAQLEYFMACEEVLRVDCVNLKYVDHKGETEMLPKRCL